MEQRVRIGDIELNILQAGAGPDLLLLPGLGANLHVWYPQLRALSSSFRVTAVDTRGHGRSSRSAGPYTVEQLAGDAAALIRTLGLAPAAVVASSMSCLTAIELAVTAPELVSSLVLVGGFPALTQAGKDRFEERARLAQNGGMEELADLVVAGALGATTHRTQPALAGLFRASVMANDPDAYVASIRAIQSGDVTARLPEVRCPTLVLLGDEEQVAPLAMARKLVAGIPGARLRVLPQAGHLPFMEQPAAFNAALVEFLTVEAGAHRSA